MMQKPVVESVRILAIFTVPPMGYAASRLGLEAARLKAGVALDSCSPVDSIAVLVCVGYAAYLAGLQGQSVYRNTGQPRMVALHMAALVAAVVLAMFDPLGHESGKVFFGTVAAWVGMAWVVTVGLVGGWRIGSGLRTSSRWGAALAALIAVLIAFWAFLYQVDRWLVTSYG